MQRIILAQGPIFEISAQDGVATCAVINRPNVSAEEGARCANQMNEVLTTLVLTPFSAYRGLLFDVRQGPPAFGPKTRAALELVFAAATGSKRKLAVLVGGSPTQRKHRVHATRVLLHAIAMRVQNSQFFSDK